MWKQYLRHKRTSKGHLEIIFNDSDKGNSMEAFFVETLKVPKVLSGESNLWPIK